MTNTQKSEISRAEEIKMALMQMYQAGFLDGINDKYRFKRRRWSELLRHKCIKAFETRFKNIKNIVERGNMIYGKPRKRKYGKARKLRDWIPKNPATRAESS
jgi:hypothetical protein